MPKKQPAKKSKPKPRKVDPYVYYAKLDQACNLLANIDSNIEQIADMVSNLGPKEPEVSPDEPDTPDEAA